MIELPTEFKQSVINRYGLKGKEWLRNINVIIEKYIEKFNLFNVRLLKDLNINILIFATSPEYGEIVMKLCAPSITTLNEIKYIQLCNSEKFEKSYYSSLEDKVLILEKINPGYPLSEIEEQNERINIFCDMLNSIVTDNIHKEGFKSYDEEFMERITMVENNKEQYKDVLYMLNTATKLYKEIKKMNLPQYVLHEDLHHKNILKSENNWKVIDPHGTIAEKVFETVMFIRGEILLYHSLDEIDKIVTSIAEKINEDKKLIYKACYVYLFSKIVYHIKVKNDYTKITQNIKICDKILEYI